MKGLEFDYKNFRFRKARLFHREFFTSLLVMFLTAFVICAFGLVCTFFFRTRTEKQLIRSNREKIEIYNALIADDNLVAEALTALQAKDASIYADVFKSSAPNVDPIGKLDFLFASDTIPDTKLVSYVYKKSDILLERADKIDREFAEIARIVSDPDFVIPPMSLPLKGINYVQVGAAEGDKVHPFYKSTAFHDGIDFIVPRGYSVRATAKGIVSEVVRSKKAKGNYVTIDHGNGWYTRYAHLSDIKVKRGNAVRLGQEIGYSGMSGQAFAPHLHYEVIRDTVVMNPINFIFASVDPGEYANMLYMSANTLQSMD